MPVLTLPVLQSVKVTPTARLLRVALDRHPFAYHAGQAVLLAPHGEPGRKPYSIACAPEQAARSRSLEFLVKADDGQKSALAALRKGSLVDLEGPVGRFRFPEAPGERHFLFIAGGTGIAPLRAMLWHALLTEPGANHAVAYSARSPQEFVYAPELRRLAREGRIALRLTVTRYMPRAWKGERGRISLSLLSSLVAERATLCFVCGPSALVEAMPPLLGQLGVARSRIRTEEW